MTDDNMIAHARAYIEAGAAIVRIRPDDGKRTKGPQGRGWQDKCADPDDFTDGDNIGIVLGEASGLLDVDLDCPEAVALAPSFLPPTDLVHGRPFNPASHYWYLARGATKQYRDVNKGSETMIVELRGTGAQTMVPPSVHPDDGDTLRWEREGDATEIAYDDLLGCVRKLAAASLLARHWPGKGARHQASMALSGMLARGGWDADSIAHFVTAISSWANRDDGEPRKRHEHATSAIAKYASGEPITGARTLINELGVPDKVISRVTDWLGLGARALIELVQNAKGTASTPKATPTGIDHDLEGALRDADRFVRALYMHPDGVRLRRWRGGWYEWTSERGCYAEIGEETIERDIYRAGKSTSQDVTEVRKALIAVDDVLISDRELGAWIGEVPEGMDDARDVVACANGLVHLPTGERIAATPRYFSTVSLGVDFDPEAPPPAQWLRFLGEVFPDDDEAITCLQELFGYVLTGDTRQQKLFMFRGGRRSGKGTVLRVLARLLGGNVAAPSLSSLATNFGLAPLIGKHVALIGDARLTGRTDVGQLLERLLSISGEDEQTVDRKHRSHWTGRLSVRFIVSTNEIPKIPDPSGALAGRVILIPFAESFYGREDVGLTDRLLTELPGILNWAIEGWRRLRERGRFAAPRSGADEIEVLEDLGDPAGAWIRECCDLGGEYLVSKVDARASYQRWAFRHQAHAKDEADLGRDLMSKGIKSAKVRDAKGKPVPHYRGVRLRSAAADPGGTTDPADPGDSDRSCS